MDDQKVMAAVAALREATQKTQVEFAVLFGKSHVTMQAYETKYCAPPEQLLLFAAMAKEKKLMDLYGIFRQALIEGVNPEIVKMIREVSENGATGQKAAKQSPRYRSKTGTND